MSTTTIAILTLSFVCIILILCIWGIRRSFKSYKQKVERRKKDALAQSRVTLEGLWIEQLAPMLPDFPYNPRDLRHLGEPIDYIVFEGLTLDKLEAIVLLEIKRTEDTQLVAHEEQIRDLIQRGKVRFDIYSPTGLLEDVDTKEKGRGWLSRLLGRH